MDVSNQIANWVREFVAGWVNSRFFPRQVHQQTSRGSSSNGLPIALNSEGKIDDSFIDGDLVVDSLSVTRNLAAASTSGPVVTIIQDHASDDQPALYVRQDIASGEYAAEFIGGDGIYIQSTTPSHPRIYLYRVNSATDGQVQVLGDGLYLTSGQDINVIAGDEFILTVDDNNEMMRVNVLTGAAISIGVSTPGINFGDDTLEDYDETPASWTPTITGVTNPTVGYTSQVGTATRIGNRIFYNARIEVSSVSGGSGNARFSIPVAAAASPSSHLGSFAAPSDPGVFHVIGGQAYGEAATASWGALNCSELTTTTYYYGGSYTV